MGEGTFLQQISGHRRRGAPVDSAAPPDPTEVADPESLTGRITRGLGLWFDVGAQLTDYITEARAERRALYRRLERQTPVMYRRIVSGAVDSGGDPLILSLGKPDQGYYWEVENVVIGGTEANVTAAGTAGLYVTAFDPNTRSNPITTPGLGYLADYAPYLPSPGFYGGRTVYVGPAEHLVLVVFSGTANQTYVANMTAQVFNVASGGGRLVGTT